jgi:pimeloyl-ACP methyl ester carboxylesterase
MPSVEANGVDLYYEVSGTGERMVLLGGGGLGRHNFDPVVPYLKKHFTLLSVDQRGYGQSASDGLDEATVDTFVDDAVALMDAVGWERAHIHGTSLGGTVALALGIRYPERATSLITNATFAKADAKMKLIFELMEDYPRRVGVMDRGVAGMVAGLFLSPSFLEAHADVDRDVLQPRLQHCPVHTWANGIRVMHEADLSAGLPNCGIPTLVIAGDIGRNGYAIELEGQGIGLRQIADLMPRGVLVEIENSSHLTIVEAPERHAKEVLAFVERLSESRLPVTI